MCECYLHCVKNVQIRSFFWHVFSRIWTEYGEILRIAPYSIRMRENTDQKSSLFRQFSRSVIYQDPRSMRKFLLTNPNLFPKGCQSINVTFWKNQIMKNCHILINAMIWEKITFQKKCKPIWRTTLQRKIQDLFKMIWMLIAVKTKIKCGRGEGFFVKFAPKRLLIYTKTIHKPCDAKKDLFLEMRMTKTIFTQTAAVFFL